MNALRWLWLVFCFPLLSFADDSHFSYEVRLSAKQLPLTENLSVELTLTFPDNYHVDVAALREHLLQYWSAWRGSFQAIIRNNWSSS